MCNTPFHDGGFSPVDYSGGLQWWRDTHRVPPLSSVYIPLPSKVSTPLTPRFCNPCRDPGRHSSTIHPTDLSVCTTKVRDVTSLYDGWRTSTGVTDVT